MADEENEKLAHPSYWDSRYLDSDSTDPEPTHEWFRTYASLTPFFEKHLFTTIPPKHPQPHILHLGSGDSTVPIELHQKGYENQTCIDFSNVVIKKMAKTETEGIKWVMGDVRDMKEQIPDTSVDVAFDKGTLDAMISGSPWDPPDIVVENTTRYINEVRMNLFRSFRSHSTSLVGYGKNSTNPGFPDYVRSTHNRIVTTNFQDPPKRYFAILLHKIFLGDTRLGSHIGCCGN